MNPEDTLTDIFKAFHRIARDGRNVEERRIEARDALLDLAQHIEKGGAPPQILLDGSTLVRFPEHLRR